MMERMRTTKARKRAMFADLFLYATMLSTMARACEITGKTTQIGGRYSNSTRATQYNPTGKVRRKANLHKRRIFIPELDTTVLVDVSTKGLRTIKKNGAYKTLKKAGVVK